MRQLLIAGGLVAAAAVGVDLLADATQTRADPHRPESRTEIVVHVRARVGAPLRAAQGLWGACQGTVNRTVLEPGISDIGNERFRFVVQPALGRHARDRLTGCLQDTTIDRVKGNVVSMEEVPAPSDGGSRSDGQTP